MLDIFSHEHRCKMSVSDKAYAGHEDCLILCFNKKLKVYLP